MTRLTVGQAKQEFSDTVNRVAYNRERIILSRRGKDVAVLVSVEDLKLLEELEDRIDLEDARAAAAEASQKGTIPIEQVTARLGM